MHKVFNNQNSQPEATRRQVIPLLIWLSILTGWLVAVFYVIQDLCLASACTDAAVYTLFGVGMGWFGIAYFSLILIVLSLRKKIYLLDRVLSLLIFAGIGAEFRLLWIQKFVIGSWCPFCVTISCTLFITAMLLLIEEVRTSGSVPGRSNSLPGRMILLAISAAAGFAIALAGIKVLS